MSHFEVPRRLTFDPHVRPPGNMVLLFFCHGNERVSANTLKLKQNNTYNMQSQNAVSMV